MSLSKRDYLRARREARRLGISLAEFFRRALDGALPLEGKKPWMKYRGLVSTGDKDSSTKIDDLISGRT